jgi:hypothetical protein
MLTCSLRRATSGPERRSDQKDWQQMIHAVRPAYFFLPGSDHDDDEQLARQAQKPTPKREDLPYRVELWNVAKTAVEEVLAITRSASIGYAAFYAAMREYPDRYLTLRDKTGIVNRWNGPSH